LEIVSASNWTEIAGQIIGISYDSNGHLQKFNFRLITYESHLASLAKKCRENNKRACPREIYEKYLPLKKAFEEKEKAPKLPKMRWDD